MLHIRLHTLHSFYLKDVGFPLTVDACERGVDGSCYSPHVLDESGVTRKNRLVVQLEKIFTYRRRSMDGKPGN